MRENSKDRRCRSLVPDRLLIGIASAAARQKKREAKVRPDDEDDIGIKSSWTARFGWLPLQLPQVEQGLLQLLPKC